MARLVLTNSRQKYHDAIARNSYAGFSDYATYERGGIYVAAHKKRMKPVENFLEIENGDFCAIAGTCIYRESMGVDALTRIHGDFDGSIERIRGNALGNYLIAIKKQNRIVLFVDKYQVLKVYYHVSDGDWFVTNSLADIGNAIAPVRVDPFAFIEETMLVGAIGTQSMFEGVSRLFGHEFIEIDAHNGQLSFGVLPYSRERRDLRNRTIQSAASEYADIVRSKFRPVARFFGNGVHIHMTGGLDSRTVFAAFMSVGCKPSIMCAVGNSTLTNTRESDLLICKEYQRRFDLHLHEMNWRENYIGAEQYWPELFHRYGFHFARYAGSRSVFAEYEGAISPYPSFMECGYFLENLRLREFAMNSGKTEFSIESFVEDYLLGGSYGNITGGGPFRNYAQFIDHLCSLLSDYMALYGIGSRSCFSLDEFDEVRWIQARNCDSNYVNLLNEFAPSIAMFSLPELHEWPFDVPVEWRANARFQLTLIKELCPEVLEIPIFSHGHKHRLDRRRLAATPLTGRVSGVVSKVLKQIGISGRFYHSIRRMYQALHSDQALSEKGTEEEELRTYILRIIAGRLDHLDHDFDPEAYQGHLVYLMLLAQHLWGVSRLNKEGVDAL